jgi:phosphinothricin acetyltransferase
MLYIAQVEEKIVGWAIIKRYSDREGYRTTAETAVYLKEDATGKGYGTTIKKFLIEKCKELEYRHLVAKIWAANKASLEYNLKLGYEIVGTQKNIGFKNGEWIDVTIMQYLIY